MVFAAQGEILAGARITIEGTARATLTDSLGSDTFPASPAGAARVRVFSTGLAPETATVVITAGQPARHDFTRRPLGEDPAPGRSPLKRAKFVVASSRALAGAAIAIHDPRFASDLRKVIAADEFGTTADGTVGELLQVVPVLSVAWVGGEAMNIQLSGAPADCRLPSMASIRRARRPTQPATCK